MSRKALALAALLIGAAPAVAQDNEEIVVTAQRYSDEYDPAVIPHVTLTRRADNVVTTIRVSCDTRDAALRDSEIRQTLTALAELDKFDDSIALSVGDEILVPFDASMMSKVIAPDDRPDSSYATLVVKTAIRHDDTFDAAVARIQAFVDQAPKTGRTLITADGRKDLSLVGPENSRSELLSLIAQDSGRTAAIFGTGFNVAIEGLEHPISWHQTGPLELALYIPYKLHTSGPHPR